MRSWRKILCPVDFSERSRMAAQHAVELGWAFAGEVTLLHVWEGPVPASADGFVATADLFDTVAPELRRKLAGWAKEFGEGVKTQVVAGVASDEIVETARRDGFDVIVMATHGRTGLAHAIVGSVAERVIRRATCPVLVMKLQP